MKLLLNLLELVFVPFFQPVEPKDVAFAALPQECVMRYDDFLRRERGAVSTWVVPCDLDGDGRAELLIWTGMAGSGGEEWSVMVRRQDAWHWAGDVFGVVYLPRRGAGILLEEPCGWSEANWSYCVLRDGEVKRAFSWETQYCRPVRQGIRKIRWK